MEFVELDEKEMKALEKQFESAGFLQSYEMWRRYKNIGREAYFIGVKREGKVVAAGLIQAMNWHFGRKIFRVPGGWVMDYDAEDYREVLRFLTEKAKVFCAEKKGIVIEIAPNIDLRRRDGENNIVEGGDHLGVREELTREGYKELGEFGDAKWVFVKDLTGEAPEEMIMKFRTTHRQLIRKAEREGVKIRELEGDEIGIFEKILAETCARQGFRYPGAEYFRSMKEAFGEKMKFLVAETADGTPTTVAAYMMYGKEMIYFYSGSVRELQKYGGAYLIQWEMFQRAQREGFKKYNFYGTKPMKGDGVYSFKKGFRGRVEELFGTFALPIGLIGKIFVGRLRYREFYDYTK